jgi:hypothetical protein
MGTYIEHRVWNCVVQNNFGQVREIFYKSDRREFTFRKTLLLDNTSDKLPNVNASFENFSAYFPFTKRKEIRHRCVCLSIHASKFLILKHIFDFHKIIYGRYASRRYPKVMIIVFLEKIIKGWRT